MQVIQERTKQVRREYYPEKRRAETVDVSVVLPSYNERDNLAVLVPSLVSLLEEAALTFEIIVVDDNSPDQSHALIREMAVQESRLRLIRRIDERGLSSAVVTGMASSVGRYCIVMDADLQHDEAVIPLMVQQLQSTSLVVGSRMADSGSYGSMSTMRRLMSYTATLLTKLILPVSLSDPMSGFFGIRRGVFEEVAERLNPKGFKILLDIVSRCKGIKVSEVGYNFRSRLHGQTKLDGGVVMQFLLALLEIRFGRSFSPTFFRYALIGSAGVVVNVVGQLLATVVFGLEFERGTLLRPSFALLIGFEMSVLFNYLANNAWTFRDRMRTGVMGNVVGYGKFHAVALYGFLIQVAVWHLLLTVFPQAVPAQIASYAANLIGILFATVNNYYLNRNFTWAGGVQTAR